MLSNKLIMGAGLDVIDGEWMSDRDRKTHPLIQYANHNQNLLVLPHIGGSTSSQSTEPEYLWQKNGKDFNNNNSNIG